VNLQALSEEALRKTGDQEIFGSLRVSGLGLATTSNADTMWELGVDGSGNVAWSRSDIEGRRPGCHSSARVLVQNAKQDYVNGCSALSGSSHAHQHYARITSSGALAAPATHIYYIGTTYGWKLGENKFTQYQSVNQVWTREFEPYSKRLKIPGTYIGGGKWHADSWVTVMHEISPTELKLELPGFQYHDFRNIYSSMELGQNSNALPSTSGWNGDIVLSYV